MQTEIKKPGLQMESCQKLNQEQSISSLHLEMQ